MALRSRGAMSLGPTALRTPPPRPHVVAAAPAPTGLAAVGALAEGTLRERACGALPPRGRPAAAAAATASGALAWQRCRGRRRRGAGAGRCRSLLRLRAAAATVDGDVAVEQLLEELRGLRAKELRKRMEGLGLDTAGCVDKDMLLEVLGAADKSVLLGALAEPAEPAPQEKSGEALEAEPVDAVPLEAEPVKAAEEELPAQVRSRLEELRAMRLRDLRRELTDLGVNTEGRVDRESLLELLETQGAAALLMAHNSSISPHEGTGIPKIPRKPACSPFPGTATVPIHMMRSADQYGVKAGSTRVITIDLECGWGCNPARFVLDTVCENSLIKAKVADNLSAEDRGQPEWAQGSDPKLKIRQVSLHTAFLGALNCGNLEVAAIEGELPVPLGTVGILGMDFLRLFDWDIDFAKGTASATTAPKDGEGPVPFDLAGMRVVPLMPVRLPGLRELLACPVKLRVPGGLETDCMGIADLGAAKTMMNVAVAHQLGLSGPPKPFQKAPEKRRKKQGKAKRGGFATPEPEPESAFQNAGLEMEIGVGKEGPVKVATEVIFGDIEVFNNMGLAYNWPAAIMGPDALCRSRLIISTRLKSIWLPV